MCACVIILDCLSKSVACFQSSAIYELIVYKNVYEFILDVHNTVQ